MFNFLKIAYTQPDESYRGRNMTRKITVGLFLLLNLIATIGLVVQLAPDFQALHQDAQTISQKMPDFTVNAESNKIQTKAEGFAYQTDSILFFFDPDNDISEKEIKDNHKALNPQLTFTVKSNKAEILLAADLLNYTINYQDMPDFSSKLLTTIFNRLGQINALFLFIVLTIAYLITLILSLLRWLFISVFAQSIALLMKLRLKFTQTLRISLLASFIPVSLMALVTAFDVAVPFNFEMIIIFSDILIWLSLKKMKARMV